MWSSNTIPVSLADVAKLLDSGRFELDLGPVRVAVKSEVDGLAPVLKLLYGHYPLTASAPFVDVRVALLRGLGFRRFIRPQVRFFVDGSFPFEPFPVTNHLPLLEWGINWSIAHRLNVNLLLHAGVIEKNGRAIVLSALPGSGKSTLTAAFVATGYRLFSDEFGIVRLADGEFIPMPRPIALKNESIPIIRAFRRDVVIGPIFRGTRKGDVAHMAPDENSVSRRKEPAPPTLIVFPKFIPGAATQYEPVAPSRAFSRLSVNSFNYELLGPAAFDALAVIARQCPAYSIRYSDLESAISTIEKLAR